MRVFIVLSVVVTIPLIAESKDFEVEEIDGLLEEENTDISSVEPIDQEEVVLISDLTYPYFEESNAMQTVESLDISPKFNLDQDLTQKIGAHWFFFCQGAVPTVGVGLRFIGPYPQHEISFSSLAVMLVRGTYNLIFPMGKKQAWYFGAGIGWMASPLPPFLGINASLIIGYWGKTLFSDLGVEPIFSPTTNEFLALPTLRLGFHF